MLPWYEFTLAMKRAGFDQEVAFFTGEVLSAGDDLLALVSSLDLDGKLATVFDGLTDVEVRSAHLGRHSREAVHTYHKVLKAGSYVATQRTSDSTQEAPAQHQLAVPAPVFGLSQPATRRFLSLHAAFTNVTLAVNLFREVWQSWQNSYAPAQAVLPAALAAATFLQLASKATEREADKTADFIMSDPELSLELEKAFQKEYRDGLARNPLDWELWLDLAESLVETHEVVDAREAIGKALALSPESPFAYLLLGRLDRLEGNLDGALANIEQATKLDPRYSDAWVETAEVLVASGRVEQASKVARKISRLDVEKTVIRRLRAKIQAARLGEQNRHGYQPLERGYRPDGPNRPPKGPPKVQSGDIKPEGGRPLS